MWEEEDWDSRSLASETVFARSSPILGVAQHSAGLPLAQHCHLSPLCWPLVAGLPVACQLACPGWTSASVRGGHGSCPSSPPGTPSTTWILLAGLALASEGVYSVCRCRGEPLEQKRS